MERLKKKQLQLLRLEKEERVQQQQAALKSLVKNHESYEIMIRYAEQYLKSNRKDKLSQFSPIQISRLIFDKQLEQIRAQFQKLPDKEVHIEHFILILTKIMNFPFEKAPLYMVGLKDMFYEIVEEGKESINYNDFFKYILGEFVTMKQEQQNTQFQVQIIERKKQDYLLHDNGIKRIYYSKDMKMMFSLDQRSNGIKIYDQDMKNINKFSPKKEKHNNKFPIILDFDYSEITQRLGLVLSDQTLSTVQLANFLKQSNTEFQALVTNQVVYSLPQKMKHIFFIQMMNKWLTISEEDSKLYIFDMQRIRTQPQKVMTKLKMDLNDQKFSSILQIVSLSCVCVVAGNQVNFYNQNLTQLRFKKFTHCQQIRHFKFSDQKNQFYLCGLQKNITIFTLNRSGSASKIYTFPTNKIVMDFQIFPYFDTIVIADQNNDVKLIHESTRVVYQQINYGHIVKAKDKSINIYKISKNQFAIYQTYLLVMSQEKIAIQRDIQYSILPNYYFDNQKEELYLSVNHQIISFSLISGQIRKNYSVDSSNIQKHHSFFMSHYCPLFILDHEFNIYQVYHKDELLQGENKNYRKKINIQEVLNCFYDTSLSTMIIVNKTSINQVRNDKNNNFNLINTINLQGFLPIMMSTFCEKSKRISFITNDQLIYQFKNYEYSIQNCYRFVFPKDDIQHEEKIITKFHYDSHYDIFIILNNKNQVYFVDRTSKEQLYFNLTQHMPTKLKKLKFSFFTYQLINEKKGIYDPFILIHDDSGFIIQFSLKKIFQEFKFSVKLNEIDIKPMFKETQKMNTQNIQIQEIQLSQQNKLKRSYEDIGLMKAHEKSIVLAMKLKVEILTTLTISRDGYIRLWNSEYKLLFSLKIPSLMRMSWNMEEIQEIKNKKSIDQLLNIFKSNYFPLFQEHQSPAQIYNKSKRLKKTNQEIPKININDPIKLQIENKDIEQIVMQKPDYTTFYNTKDKARTASFFHTTSKIYSHPWRKNKEFINIYSKAQSPVKYTAKMPNYLIELRSSLDMTERVKQKANYKEAERLLPQLSFYQPQKFQSERKKDETIQNQEQVENFESCLYVKKQKKKKKINELDEIDKEFKKKEMILTARKWIPKKNRQRNSSVVELKSQVIALNLQKKVDPIKAIEKIFQQHNRQCMETKKGRMIRVPKINFQKDIY